MSKHDFDMAVTNAQEALRAKTSSSQAMLQQASSAMRNAVTALSLSEQEVANLRQSVNELKQQRDAAGGGDAGPATDRERAQLRAAQARLAELSQNFRALQSEVARHRYEQDGTAMPVASAFPLRIDPMLSSKVVCIAQLVMLGYSYGDAENALDAVRVNDTIVALEWLEARNVVKISLVGEADAAAFRSAFANTAAKNCLAFGPGINERTVAKYGVEIPFLILAKDTCNAKRTSGGDEFIVEVSKEDDPRAPKGTVRLVDLDNGLHEVYYSVPSAGRYRIDVGYDDLGEPQEIIPIRGSPFTMDFEDPWTYKRTSGAAPLKRKFGQITSLSNDKVALFGGSDDGVSVLTTGADGWTWDTASTDGQPAARKFHGQTGAGGKLVVFGGAALGGEEMDDLATFTVEGPTGSWQTVEGVKPYRAMKSRHQVISDEKEAAEEAAAVAAVAKEPPSAPETPNPAEEEPPALVAKESDEPKEDTAPAAPVEPELDERLFKAFGVVAARCASLAKRCAQKNAALLGGSRVGASHAASGFDASRALAEEMRVDGSSLGAAALDIGEAAASSRLYGSSRLWNAAKKHNAVVWGRALAACEASEKALNDENGDPPRARAADADADAFASFYRAAVVDAHADDLEALRVSGAKHGDVADVGVLLRAIQSGADVVPALQKALAVQFASLKAFTANGKRGGDGDLLGVASEDDDDDDGADASGAKNASGDDSASAGGDDEVDY